MTLQDILGDAYMDGMTIEQVNEALAAVTLPDNSAEIQRLRNSVSRANSEAAESRRKLQEAMAKGEADVGTWQAKYADLDNRFKTLERERTIEKHKASFLELGYGADLAAATAEAMVNGDLATVFANQKAFLDAHDKQVLANTMRKGPQPGAAGGGTGTAAPDFSQQLNEARATGDWARVAALTRMQQEAANK